MGLFSALESILERFGLYEGKPSRICRKAFRDNYPTLTIDEVRVRSKEQSRTVVAVFFQLPGKSLIEPTPYKLFVVHGETVDELPYSDDCPYAYRNRK